MSKKICKPYSLDILATHPAISSMVLEDYVRIEDGSDALTLSLYWIVAANMTKPISEPVGSQGF
jgi:hypothetical protein